LQFSYFDAKQDITKNYIGDVVVEKLDELLTLPFKSIYIQTVEGDIQVQVKKSGKVFIRRHKPSGKRGKYVLEHDRRKELLLPDGEPDPFLRTIGLTTAEGRVKARAQAKFRQVNEFLKFTLETGVFDEVEKPLHIVDCGSGSAYLTFAVYHYLVDKLGLQVKLTGVDDNEELIRKTEGMVEELGWKDVAFTVSRIMDFEPADPVDAVITLHACDTATDEALAKGVVWGSRLIVSVPCCHHHLQQQMTRSTIPSQLAPLARQNILKERMGDILTDSFRVLILQSMGYRTDVIEFISTEHTSKNLMIRAVRSAQDRNPEALCEYREMKDFWQVKPYLEGLLEEELHENGF